MVARQSSDGDTGRPPTIHDSGATRPLFDARRADLIDSLNGMAISIGEVDSKASDRMQELARAINDDVLRQRWSDVDLRRAFNTERLSHAFSVRRSGGPIPAGVETADRIRNVMVLLPIFLTWAALAEATLAYRRYIDRAPESVVEPFLLLWQRGFGGEASWYAPTFSTVAIMDAVIIGIIIILTFYSHGRREAHEDAIIHMSQDFQADLDNVLAEASVELAADRAMRPIVMIDTIERIATRFDSNSQELLNRLRIEHDRLDAFAVRREKELGDFGVFASGMRMGAEETHRLLLDVRQVSAALQRSLEDMTGEVSLASDQQRTLLGAVQSLERMIGTDMQGDQAVARQLADTASRLGEVTDKALMSAESAAVAGRIATEAIRGISDLKTGDVASALNDIASTIAQLRDDFADLLADQNDITRSLQAAARDLGGGAPFRTIDPQPTPAVDDPRDQGRRERGIFNRRDG